MKTAQLIDEIKKEAEALQRHLNEVYKEGHIDMTVKVTADSLCHDFESLNVKRWVSTAAQRGRRVVALQEQVHTLQKLTAPQRPTAVNTDGPPVNNPMTTKRARKRADLRQANGHNVKLPVRIDGKYGRAARIDLGSVRIEVMDMSKNRRG